MKDECVNYFGQGLYIFKYKITNHVRPEAGLSQAGWKALENSVLLVAHRQLGLAKVREIVTS